MKKNIVLMLFLFSVGSAFGQTVNKQSVSDLKNNYEYVMIELRQTDYLMLSYGQDVSMSGGNAIVRDENGKKLKFNSHIDKLNFMVKYGYEVVLYSDNSNFYLLRVNHKKEE